MLNLRSPDDVGAALDVSIRDLSRVLRQSNDFYEDLLILDPRKPKKQRIVTNSLGLLRELQARFYQDVLLKRLDRNRYTHGGVPGRSVLTNIRPHIGQSFVFTTDISGFYPGIHRKRVIELFARLGCSPEAALICARLCTHKHCLAQGLITSPILADRLMHQVDERIAGACSRHDLSYTRFVDDISIAGPFDLRKSGIPNLVRRILKVSGFKVNSEKDQFGSAKEGAAITNLRFRNGHPDVSASYCKEVERQLRDLASLGEMQAFDGPYYTQNQIWGRVQFICWVNPGRRRALMSLLGKVNWSTVRQEARRRGLERNVARVVRRAKLAKLAISHAFEDVSPAKEEGETPDAPVQLPSKPSNASIESS